MSMLTRWNPFKSQQQLSPFADFDDFFRGFGLRPFMREFEAAPQMRLEVSEDDKAYQVTAEIPGVNKDDISVSAEGNQLSISAEVKRASEGGEQNELHCERYYGRVFRSFTLPQEVDSDNAEARYENGVLKLTLPKRADGTARRIQVS